MYELSRQYFTNFKQAIDDLERIKEKYMIDFSIQTDSITEKKFYFEVMNNLQRLEKVFGANIKTDFDKYCLKLKDIGCVTREEFYKQPWRQRVFKGLITDQMVSAATKKGIDFGVFVISDILNFGVTYYDNIKEYVSHIFMGRKIENSRIEMWLKNNGVRMESKDKIAPVDIVVTTEKKSRKKNKK